MNDRIKQVRKSAKLTQENFATSLNLKKTTIQGFEYNQIKPSDRTISDICRIYKVNENWLRTGEGEMFAPKSWEEEVADITTKIFTEDNEFRKKLISTVANLSDEEIDVLHKIAEQWLNETKK